MRPIRQTIFLFVVLLFSACQPATALPGPTFVPSPISATATATATVAPSPSPTFTPDPSLPCGVMTEHVYLFLDCNDIRRIRARIDSGDERTMTAWRDMRAGADEYMRNIPKSYDPDDTTGKLWSGSHGNYHARDMALVYLVSGEKIYANGVIQLLDTVKRGTPTNAHMTRLAPAGDPGVGSGGLLTHYAFGELPLQSVLFSYLAVRDSGLLSPEQVAEYDEFFKHQAVIAEEVAAELGNNIPVESWLNRNTPMGANISAATLSIAFSDDPDMLALHDRVRQKMEWQLGNWFEPDGNWGEDADGYGYRILEGLTHYAEAARKLRGEDLYQLDFNGRNLHLLCEWHLKAVTPIGTTPAMNDTPHASSDPSVFQLCAYRTNDPALNFLYEKYMQGWDSAYSRGTKENTPFNILAWTGLTAQSVEPSFASISAPDVGATIFRDGWGSDNQYLLLQFTDSQVHAENAYGNILLFDHGPWIVGNGYHFSSESQAGQPTDQHSTLALDFRDQENIGGELLAFADLFQAGISSVTARSYDSMRHTRTVLWMKPFHHWLVVDDANVDGRGNHTLQLRWYVRGNGREISPGMWNFTRSGPGKLTIQVLTDLSTEFSAISRKYDWEEWINNANGLMANMIYSNKPVRIISSLNPDLADDPPSTVVRTDSDQGTEILVQRADMEWLWILPIQFADVGVVGESQIEGNSGCEIRGNGELQGYCLMLGKSLVMRGQPLVTADAPVYVEVDFMDGMIVVESDSNVLVTLYVPFDVKFILENGSQVQFESADSLITIQVSAGRHILNLQK